MCLQVLNSGPSRSIETVAEIALPKILTPYRHRLLQVVDWQVRQYCSGSDTVGVKQFFSICVVSHRFPEITFQFLVFQLEEPNLGEKGCSEVIGCDTCH